MGTQNPEFVRPHANMPPQATKSFQNTSLPYLVNNHAACILPQDSLMNRTSPCNPTLEQAQAIATLRYFPSSDVIAWHTLSQSTEPVLKHRDGPGGLSIQAIRAISVLSSCSRQSLLQWFEPADGDSPPISGLSTCKFVNATSSRQTRPPSPRSDPTSAHLSFFKPVNAISPHLSQNPYSALTAVHSPRTPVQTLLPPNSHQISALAKRANPNHTYWCTVCGDRSYKNSDDWKKHEKEHEIKYVCMLNGLLEPTETGQLCVLCGVLNPPVNHHLAHNIASCLEEPGHTSFKRRYDMVGHLKDAHNISKGGTIADKWRCESFKKAWSCGFCIQLLPTLQARLKHVGTEHFERGQSINEWDTTKLIQGLLLQAEIQKAWQSLLNSVDPFRLSQFKWNKVGSEDLQQRLEKGLVGRETPQSLAKAAYDNAEYDWSLADIDDTAFAANMNTELTQYISKTPPPPSPEQAVISRKGPVECHAWGPPLKQASQIPRTSPIPDIQSAYVTAASISPRAYHTPVLDYEPVCKPLPSDTDDTNGTQPTTPSNDRFGSANPSVYTSWSGYNTIPELTHSAQEELNYKSNDNIAWSTVPHPYITFGPSTLKRPRESTSPPTSAFPCKPSLKKAPRKKRYRKIEEGEMASWNVDLDYGQRGARVGEDARSESETLDD